MTKGHKRFVEAELKLFRYYQRRLEEIRIEILTDGAIRYDTERVAGGPGDPTARKVEKLISCLEIRRLEELIKAIDRALQELEKHHNELFELRYKQKKDIVETCRRLSCSERTYRRWNNRLIEAVGQQMGY